MADKDYSATPLPRKLGIREGSMVVCVRAPRGFVLAPLPPGAHVTARAARSDVVLLFVKRLSELERRFGVLKAKLAPDGGLWVAYPKKSSGVATDLTFDNVQKTGLDAGMVDNKSCAIDETWSAVRFVYRVKDRPRR
jgi:hypothetical protein